MISQIAKTNMLKQQLRTGDVLNESILDLYRTIPREDFVPAKYKSFAYSDMQLPLEFGQRMFTPVEEGKLLQSLRLTGTQTVLEVGTGSGFLTALLSRLAKKVISVDCFSSFTSRATEQLNSHGCDNVELYTGDASLGFMDKAPYDVMVFTAALPLITDSHRLQLLPGGKLFAIVGKEPVMQAQLHTLSQSGNWEEIVLFETNIPPLIEKFKPKEFVF